MPEAVTNVRNAYGDILTTIKRFVSAVENALLRESQSVRKSYPDPYESMILHSVVYSQSTQSTTSAHSSSARQRSVRSRDSTSASNNNSISCKESPISYVGRLTTAIATATASRVDTVRSPSEASSTATIRAPSPSNALPECVISSSESTSSNSVDVFLTKGQPSWYEIYSTSYSLQVRTPNIHLIISQDELVREQWTPETLQKLVADCGHYWFILEYLSDCIIPEGQGVPPVKLLDVPTEREMILDYGTAKWPRRLRVCSKGDVISITYSLRKPMEGLVQRI